MLCNETIHLIHQALTSMAFLKENLNNFDMWEINEGIDAILLFPFIRSFSQKTEQKWNHHFLSRDNLCTKQGTPLDRPWWLSGRSRHVSNWSRDRHLGPRFESRLRHGQIYIWLQLHPLYITSPFPWSQHRKQFQRRANNFGTFVFGILLI